MIITIDVGNTTTNFCCFDDDEITQALSMHTQKTDTSNELTVKFLDLLKSVNLDFNEVEAISISCVVPVLSVEWKKLSKNNNIKFYECNPQTAASLPESVFYSDAANPDEVGADYIAACIGAKTLTDKPCVVFDFGTATNAAVIDKNGHFIGGVIIPGLETSLNSLIEGASALHEITLETPKQVIGFDTETCIQSGIVYGEACRVDGLIERMEDQLGYALVVFITGGLSGLISPNIKHENIWKPNLIHLGLLKFYKEFRE